MPDGLPDPRTPAGRAGIAALLERPERAVVGVDFDGTLSPIVPDPENARADPAAVEGLAALAPHVAAVAVITGRPARSAVSLAGLEGVAGLEGLVVLGHYGLERWEASTGEVTTPDVVEGVARARDELPSLLESLDAVPAARVEDKGLAVAVHTRGADDAEALLERLRGPLTDLAERCGLEVEPGRLVLELRPPGNDKGGALRGLLEAHDADVAVFLGDDLGDLPAFDAIHDLRSRGGAGLIVCSESGGVEQAAEVRSRADLVVEGPAGVARLLTALAAAISAA